MNTIFPAYQPGRCRLSHIVTQCPKTLLRIVALIACVAAFLGLPEQCSEPCSL